MYGLGPCLVSNMPLVYLQNLNPSAFIKYYTILGNAFQPDTNEIATISSLISLVF